MNEPKFMTADPHCISPDVTLMDAIMSMKALDVNVLPVCDGDRIVATITERDIVIRAADDDCDIRLVKVHEVMNRNPICCFDDHDTHQAAEIMRKNRVRRLPVLNQSKRLIGLVSLGDLAVQSNIGKKVGGILQHWSAAATPSPSLASTV